MRIMIIQTEIEEAIAAHILGQMSINDDMELKIDLSATRGPEGYTANIEVVPKQAVKLPTRKASAARAQAATKAAETPADNAKSDQASETTQDAGDSSEQAQDEAPGVDANQEAEAAPTSGSTGSIFGNLRKPVNEKPAEEAAAS